MESGTAKSGFIQRVGKDGFTCFLRIHLVSLPLDLAIVFLFFNLAMKLMTGLVEVAVIVSVQLQTTQRQYDMENSKKAHDRASDRMEELQATISEVTHTLA